MKLKNCRKCGELKPLDDYYKHKEMFDGHLNICKECKKSYERKEKNFNKYAKTEKGVIRHIFKGQTYCSKTRGHSLQLYSKEELREWLYKNGFKELFNEWVASGHKKRLKPSVDRLDNTIGYSFNNIRLVTFGKNEDQADKDTISGTLKRRQKPISQYTKDGVFVKSFHSQAEASRQTGICTPSISKAFLGKRKTAGGYVWKN